MKSTIFPLVALTLGIAPAGAKVFTLDALSNTDWASPSDNPSDPTRRNNTVITQDSIVVGDRAGAPVVWEMAVAVGLGEANGAASCLSCSRPESRSKLLRRSPSPRPTLLTQRTILRIAALGRIGNGRPRVAPTGEPSPLASANDRQPGSQPP